MQGTPKAIEMNGIVRNATKIGVQDGQAEDLINLRFMDGSWRASGNGRQIENMPTGTIYQQIYVHTNIYHHLLGVDNGVLYWFAEIDNDGVTFYPLDGTTDRSGWPEDKQGLPTERKALTTVVGDVWITQTGHLLTIIDENDDFEHFVFKTGEDKYIEVNMDVNGKQTDRSLYPFGQVHFNLYKNPEYTNNKESENSVSPASIFPSGQQAYTFNHQALETIASSEIMHSQYISMLAEQSENNRFTLPFLAMVALKLYDGSFVYSSNPIFLNPNERSNKNDELFVYDQIKDGWEASTVDDFFDKSIPPSHITGVNEDWKENSFLSIPNVRALGSISGGVSSFTFDKLFVGGNTGQEIPEQYDARENAGHRCLATLGEAVNEPTFSSGGYVSARQTWDVKCNHRIFGYELIASFGEEITTYLSQNSDIIKSVCIFITPQIDNLKLEKEDKNSTEKRYGQFKVRYYNGGNSMFFGFVPNVRPTDEILFDLIHQPFYLLREYTVNTIQELLANPIVDLSSPDYKSILKSEILVQQQTLNTETLSRTTYLPKVSYMYNGRLHIANYKAYPFFGYPIDLFHLHNHSVKVEEGAWFPEDADGQRVLPNLAGNNDAYLQYPKEQIEIKDAAAMGDSGELIDEAAPYFLVKVYIDTAQGEQIVTRYIPAYDTSTQENGRADFIEDLNPLLTYPDARAKKMDIYFVDHYVAPSPTTIVNTDGYYLKRKEFTLKPHPYLNMAYYIDPELKPIKLSEFDNWPANIQPLMQ